MAVVVALMMMSFNPMDEDNNNPAGNGSNGGGGSSNNKINGYEYVDLGLPSGLKWATCNVGANKPEDFGTNMNYDEALVAYKYWGGSWRMPTKSELEELRYKCTWVWITQNGVNGYKVIGPNGSSIFLPAAGLKLIDALLHDGERGYYWSSTPEESDVNSAYRLHFSELAVYVIYDFRRFGQSVRLVSEYGKTMTMISDLSEGTHTLKLEEQGYEILTKDIVIQKGETLTTNEKLQIESQKIVDDKQQTSSKINGYEYVDLGLPSGLKWATCNVGATTPEDYGNYYAWGETSTKSSYTFDNSKTFGKTMNDISGNAQYDAATANWGGSWRMPTEEELSELVDLCTWVWITQNGVNGNKVIGLNGNSIFLPAAGFRVGSLFSRAGEYGDYWGSTPEGEIKACAFSSDSGLLGVNSYYRLDGLPIRPVSK